MKLTVTTSIIANLLVSRVSGAATLQLYQGSQTIGVDTWEEARDFCIAKDSTLATKAQICKNGLTSPGLKSGNHWAPVLDGSDRYIQAGSGNRNGDTCQDFKDLCKITPAPTSPPTQPPTNPPTPLPTPAPTPKPTPGPTPSPTNPPTHNPTLRPTAPPTSRPTPSPTPNPTPSPTNSPTDAPKLKGGCQRPPGCDPHKGLTSSCAVQGGCGLPGVYYPDPDDCAGYCYATGTNAPCRYEVVDLTAPQLVVDPYCRGSFWDVNPRNGRPMVGKRGNPLKGTSGFCNSDRTQWKQWPSFKPNLNHCTLHPYPRHRLLEEGHGILQEEGEYPGEAVEAFANATETRRFLADRCDTKTIDVNMILCKKNDPTPAPTASPTTSAPTTAAPTTSAPTTAAPTTASPTTSAPTTAAPTVSTGSPSHSPTTAAPSTAGPTTSAPTTAAPTTAAPSTASPTTATPTTAKPTVTIGSPSVSPTTARPTEAPTVAPTPLATNPTTTITPRTTPTQPPNKTTGKSGGDPHFQTWSGSKFDYHGECDLVLLQNPSFANELGMRLHIRTTRKGYYSYIESIALQIGNETLEFNNDLENFLINGIRVEDGSMESKNSIAGYEVRRYRSAISVRVDKRRHGKAHIDFLRRGSGFPYVKLDGKETDIFQGSLGLLGDWDTGSMVSRDGLTQVNDATAYALEWQVRDYEPMLFSTSRSPQYPTKCIPPKKMLGKRLGDSHMILAAEKACAAWKEDKEDCVFDVMATRSIDSADSYGDTGNA